MESIAEYFLKMTVGYGLLVGFYWLFFRKDTLFRRNRIYLLMCLVLPILLPQMRFPMSLPWSVVGRASLGQKGDLGLDPDQFLTERTDTTAFHFDYQAILLVVYAAGVGVCVVRAILAYHSVYRIIQDAEKKIVRSIVLALTQRNIAPFSIFKWLVISQEKQNHSDFEKILEHEMVHCRKKHSMDVVVAEIVLALQWFNPFVWLLKYAMIENHEYQVDQELIKNGMDPKSYQYALLNEVQVEPGFALVNNFNTSLIKNRIQMMNKKSTSPLLLLKSFLLLPLLVGMTISLCSFQPRLVAMSQTEGIVQMEKSVVSDTLTVMEIKKDKSLPWDDSNPPLVFLDGKIVNVDELYQLNPNQIQSIDVSRNPEKRIVEKYPDAKNGVIEVTTKKTPNSLLSQSRGFEVIRKSNTEQNKTAVSQNGLRLGQLNPEGNAPMCVVMGKEIEFSSLNEIDPNTIESISVLKGQQAVEKYGGKGENGVVQITMKTTLGNQTGPNDLQKETKPNSELSTSSSDGQEGEKSQVKVKIKGKSAQKAPLYVVDGESVSEKEVKKLAPNSIAKMEVFKGKSAEERFGRKARNGVVVITLKK